MCGRRDGARACDQALRERTPLTPALRVIGARPFVPLVPTTVPFATVSTFVATPLLFPTRRTGRCGRLGGRCSTSSGGRRRGCVILRATHEGNEGECGAECVTGHRASSSLDRRWGRGTFAVQTDEATPPAVGRSVSADELGGGGSPCRLAARNAWGVRVACEVFENHAPHLATTRYRVPPSFSPS
jgi:hypothetical protein